MSALAVKKRMWLTAMSAAVVLAASGCPRSQGPGRGGLGPEKSDIVTALEENGFTTFAKLVAVSGMDQTLKGSGPYTVFAPTDDAFAHMGEGAVDDLMKPEKKAELEALVKGHVHEGKLTDNDLLSATSVTMLTGKSLSVGRPQGVLMIGGAELLSTPIQCTNGIIHTVDKVLPAGT